MLLQDLLLRSLPSGIVALPPSRVALVPDPRHSLGKLVSLRPELRCRLAGSGDEIGEPLLRLLGAVESLGLLNPEGGSLSGIGRELVHPSVCSGKLPPEVRAPHLQLRGWAATNY